MQISNLKSQIETTIRSIAVGVLAVVSAQPLVAQVLPNRPAPDVITLDFDSAMAKRLTSVEDFVLEKQWEVVATLLRQSPADKSDALVPLAPHWFVGVRRYCQCRAAALPTAGLAAYRRQMDATAKKWLDDAQSTNNRDGWRRIILDASATSFGDDAARQLAQESFESGDFSGARSSWEFMLPAPDVLRSAAGIGLVRHPDVPSDAADIRAALVLCSLFAGNVERAKRELSAFQKLHPDVHGRLAGRDGVLAELLSEQILEAHPPLPPLRIEEKSDLPFERAIPLLAKVGPAGVKPQLDQLLWRRALAQPFANAAVTTEIGDVLPQIANGIAFASNGESVFAFDTATGGPKWSGNAIADNDSRSAIIHSLADPAAPKWPIGDRPLHTLTITGNRLYARLGTPVTGRAKQESQAHSEIVGLDIGAGEGKLVWRVSADEFDSRDPLAATAPWCFEGSPAADDRRVFVAMRRSLPQQQINVACFDAETARLLWNRRVGITVAATEETVNSTSHLCLTLAEDSVFVSTDCGAIAALDVNDGAVRWLRTYSSEASQNNFVRRFGHTPPFYRDGVVFVAPLDSRLLLAIHAESGLLLWQREWPEPLQYLLGSVGETLIASGRSLWGVRMNTGETAWPHRRVGFADPEGFSYGRGCVIGDEVLWPNRDELFVVAAQSGEITRRTPLRESAVRRGGHLTVAGPYLLISSDNNLRMLGPAKIRERE